MSLPTARLHVIHDDHSGPPRIEILADGTPVAELAAGGWTVRVVDPPAGRPVIRVDILACKVVQSFPAAEAP